MIPKAEMTCEPVKTENADEFPDTEGAKYENEPANFDGLPPMKAVTLRFDPVPSFAKQVILESETTTVSEQEVLPTNMFASTTRGMPKLYPDSNNLPPKVPHPFGLTFITTAAS
jgi:hypothetical protein